MKRMFNKKLIVPFSATGKNSFLVFTLLVLSFACHKSNINEKDSRNFDQVNLVANSEEYHPVTKDTTLLNAFGIAWTPNGIAWVNSVGGHVSELYSAEGAIVRHPVNIPSPTDQTGDFPVESSSVPARVLTCPMALLISYFPVSMESCLAGMERWVIAFTRVQMSFVDPTLPDGYSPYNIQAVGDWLYVMYAELATSGPGAGHGIAGPGKGFVSVFGTDGRFIRRFASQGTLNIPWGVTMAPGGFLDDDDLSNDGGNNNGGYGEKGLINYNNDNNQRKHDPKDPLILVGNFGDDPINVFNQDGTFIGQLHSHHHTIIIDGLWSLSFAPSSATGIDPSRLYFTAGPDQERDGIFGYLLKK
jgi:hypothetical protein